MASVEIGKSQSNRRLTLHPSRLALHVIRFTFYALLIAPLVVFVLHAFSLRWFYPQVLPREWTIAPFLSQISNPRTQEALWESLKIAVLTSVLSLVAGYPAARTLSLRDFRGKGFVLLLFFLPTVAPPAATGMGLNILFLRLGWAGTDLSVVLVHLIPVLPYTIFSLIGVFARYDPNFEAQALVLGASQVRIFWSVTLPLIFPGIVVAMLFAFLISWSQYLLTLLIGSGRVITLPILLFSTVSGGNPTSIAILSLLFVAPPILIIIATVRYLGEQRMTGQY
jgi:putative spermidine/putrescine transport system permease protein